MDVLSKLRPGAASRAGGGHVTRADPEVSTLPIKEDILHTLDSFGAENKENNNNGDPLLSLSSDNKLDTMFGEPWEDLGSGLSTPASLSHSYSLEWEKLFSRPEMMRYLKSRAAEGELRSSRFRSVVWKLFLEVLPSNKEEWISKTRVSRARFEELKNKLIVNPRKAVDSVDITLNNPLSQDEESPWNKFFQDNELRLTIKQDVIRTYPRIEFFQSNQLRNLMVNILFIFAKENVELSYRQEFPINYNIPLGLSTATLSSFPEVEFFRKHELGEMMTDILFVFSREHATHSYRQGMHELLAPLIFVLHCDHQAFLHACEIESVLYSSEKTRTVMKEVMDPAFLEHDAYTMFCQVMETVEPWYLSRDIFCNPRTGSLRNLELLHATPFARSQDLNPSNAIVTKLTRIQDYILKKFDPELHQHLERLEIAPQIYGIRWLRLLFGREFPMQDLLMLWDAIFGDGIGFDLVDYIFVAMLLYIRDILLTSDYATCLTVLMKFPPVADVHYFVVKAMWLREPNQYPRPPNYTHQGPIKTSSSMGGSSDGLGVVGTGASDNKSSTAATTSKKPRDNDPVGSTVSLSQVEDSMFRNMPSGSSLARLDTGSNLRSAQSSPGIHHSGNVFPLTPDDLSVASSPTKYNTLPNKQKTKQKKLSKMEQELQHQVAQLQGELHDKENMCRYCSSKLDVHIDRLQQDLSKSEHHIEGEVMVSLAGLKLVRDILNGTLRFTQNITSDEDIAIIDGYYGSQNGGAEAETSMVGGDYSKVTTTDASPESDILLGASSASSIRGGKPSGTRDQQAKLFYMSSEETTSPSEENFPPGAVRQTSTEDARGLRNDGEMRDMASHSRVNSTNPFLDSFHATDNSLNSTSTSGGVEGPSTSNSSSAVTTASSSSSSSSKIKSMFKISSTSASNALSAGGNNSSNKAMQHHHSYVGVDPSTTAGPQPPPSFSSFESLPASLMTVGGNASNLSSFSNSGEFYTSINVNTNNKVGPGKDGGGVYRELSSFESNGQRSRSKSDVTGSNSYWPDFLSSNIRLPWYTESNGDAERSRERSRSQPVTAKVVEELAVGGGYDDDEDEESTVNVNPLYKLKYHATMEH
ncbi:hypothetical protein RRG08_010155 [Elysia crispata]|uniref:Rab-GAP TBC domain-containing protein n=1 Tax=Elysia crispata TaxID=231223 RepID=A0AAE1AKQ2_9GAST|nr:hypothetical protein RRG08_010155 [Elysia crispata]